MSDELQVVELNGIVEVSGACKTTDDLMERAGLAPDEWEIVPGSFDLNVWNAQISGDRVVELYRAKAKFQPIPAQDPERVKADVIAAIEAKAPHISRRYPRVNGTNTALEVALFDVHLGKLAHAEETGTEYNLDEASRIFREVAAEIVADAEMYRPEVIVFPIGNDFLHVDHGGGGSGYAQTTNGTPQDISARNWLIFRRGRELLIELIDALSEVAPVQVITVPGNHDTASTFFMGEVIGAWYRNNENVEVDTAPAPQKIWEWNGNMVFFCHGQTEKPAELPLAMAEMFSEEWGRAHTREIHTGHIHQEKVREVGSTRIRSLPSISGTDRWHRGRLYRARREAQAILWNANGVKATLRYPV